MTRSNNEIPVRRRGGGVPWWAWLIGLVVLGLLAYTLLSNMNRGGGTGGASTSPAGQVTTPGASEAASPDGSGTGGASPAGSTGTDASGAGASGSPASSWIGTDTVTVALPAHTTAA